MNIRFPSPKTFSWLLALAVLIPAGCSNMLGRSVDEPKKLSADKPSHSEVSVADVKVESDGLALGETDRKALSPQQLVEEVSRLLEEQKPAAAQRLVQRYPDVAWDLLRNATAREAGNRALREVAAAHDRQCTRPGVEENWQALLRDRAEHPDRYRRHDLKREAFLTKLREGNPEAALSLGLTDLPSEGPVTLLEIDAWHLTGVALLLAERPGEAAQAFSRAIDRAKNTSPYQTAHLQLLLSDAARRVGDTKAADARWLEAIDTAGRLIEQKTAVTDPTFWEQAAYQRPVEQNWPAPLTDTFAAHCRDGGIGAAGAAPIVLASGGDTHYLADEQSLWGAIGLWRLDRDEPEAALVALKRAEAMASDPAVKERLRLVEAKSLLALGQSGGATAILVNLMGSDDRPLGLAATSTLGTVKLESGNVKQGLVLLQRAVEREEGIEWPGRAEAEADLGLAYLLLGDEPAGLRWLHAAQKRFEAAGQWENLVQSLENEQSYLEHTKKKSQREEVELRLASLQSR